MPQHDWPQLDTLPIPKMTDHTMKRFDNGDLTIHKRDCDFTVFLDPDLKYHNEFVTRLNEHVIERGYVWQNMLEQEAELSRARRRL